MIDQASRQIATNPWSSKIQSCRNTAYLVTSRHPRASSLGMANWSVSVPKSEPPLSPDDVKHYSTTSRLRRWSSPEMDVRLSGTTPRGLTTITLTHCWAKTLRLLELFGQQHVQAPLWQVDEVAVTKPHRMEGRKLWISTPTLGYIFYISDQWMQWMI